MAGGIHVLGFAGSLRAGSYNRALLRTAKELAPGGMTIEVFELEDIPLYNGDVEKAAYPEPVRVFKDKIRAADALLIATPEYNYSIPGVLKNAIDWASRPPTDIPFTNKPTAIMGASTSGFGTVRSQLALRHVLFAVSAQVLTDPEVYVSRAKNKFDADGNLIDEDVTARVKSLLHALGEWTRLLNG